MQNGFAIQILIQNQNKNILKISVKSIIITPRIASKTVENYTEKEQEM